MALQPLWQQSRLRAGLPLSTLIAGTHYESARLAATLDQSSLAANKTRRLSLMPAFWVNTRTPLCAGCGCKSSGLGTAPLAVTLRCGVQIRGHGRNRRSSADRL